MVMFNNHDYTICLEHVISSKIIVMHNVRAASEQDAIEVAKDHMATPHHWRSYNVIETTA
jgi:hypothetical protein